ncbi:MAG: exo-alpha-sialidase, partial [bacterium]|nr:exo-alpha-sialidase [bacterium]
MPPGFTYGGPANPVAYMADEGHRLVLNNGALDKSPESNKIGMHFDTTGWKPGLYHLELTLRSVPSVDRKPDVRNVALKVRSPNDRLKVTVSKSRVLCPGTHANRMTRLSDGTVLHATHFSADDGKTWRQRDTGTIGNGCVELRNGQVLGMPWRDFPSIKGRKGWHQGQRYVSLDMGHTVRTDNVEFHVPKAKAAYGHGPHVGPLFDGSIIERADGSLVALMYGWFVGDDKICPHSSRRPYSRTYTCLSEDGGKTWRYLSTAGYDFIGSEGYNEGSMRELPNGDFLAVMRTGNMRDKLCQDNPIMLSHSSDGGKTWSEPWRT